MKRNTVVTKPDGSQSTTLQFGIFAGSGKIEGIGEITIKLVSGGIAFSFPGLEEWTFTFEELIEQILEEREKPALPQAPGSTNSERDDTDGQPKQS